MKFTAKKEVFEKFFGLNIGILICKDINNSDEDPKTIKILKEMEDFVRQTFVPEQLAKKEEVIKWENAYKRLGVKSHHYHSSVEELLDLILSGKDISKENKLVDIYNFITLKYLIPTGGDDLNKITGNITLDISKDNEHFRPKDNLRTDTIKPGELIYKDEKTVLARRFSWIESELTKIDENTRNTIIYIDALPMISRNKLDEIMNELKDLIITFCGGDVKTFVVNQRNLEVEF